MKTTPLRLIAPVIALCAIALGVPRVHAQFLPERFTYQGHLELNESAVDGPCDMLFTLYDAESGGSMVGTGGYIFDDPPVDVVAGEFAVKPDFGADSFDGNPRWIEVQVRFPAGTGNWQTLSPRQELTATPYALQTRGIHVDHQLRVGIGTSTPAWPLDMSQAQSVLRMQTTTSTNGSVIELQNTLPASNFLGAINFNDDLGGYPGQISYSTQGAQDVLRFRIGGISPSFYTRWGLNLVAGGQYRDDATLRSINLNPDGGMAAYMANNSTWATAHLQNNGSGEVLWMEQAGTGNYIVATNGSDWKFWVDNQGVTHTKVLEIHGGSDLSETFDVDTGEDQLLPGMTVSIDSRREGGLALSRQPYDHRVAGIVSGAGGVKPGMLMGQKGTVASGEHPVALTGRVYCWVDADYGAVEPGDLLTTSATAGHAMKVKDPARTQGAVLGKAMGSLDSGRGLVLVLVGLQ